MWRAATPPFKLGVKHLDQASHRCYYAHACGEASEVPSTMAGGRHKRLDSRVGPLAFQFRV